MKKIGVYDFAYLRKVKESGECIGGCIKDAPLTLANEKTFEFPVKIINNPYTPQISPLDSNVNGCPEINPTSIKEIKDYYEECKEKDTYCNLVLKRTPYLV